MAYSGSTAVDLNTRSRSLLGSFSQCRFLVGDLCHRPHTLSLSGSSSGNSDILLGSSPSRRRRRKWVLTEAGGWIFEPVLPRRIYDQICITYVCHSSKDCLTLTLTLTAQVTENTEKILSFLIVHYFHFSINSLLILCLIVSSASMCVVCFIVYYLRV